MSERIGNHGWRIWKEKGLPQEVVPLSDAEGVVAQIEEENEALKDKLMEINAECLDKTATRESILVVLLAGGVE